MHHHVAGETFAVSDTSVNEVGCIHTSKGLEFDYGGIGLSITLREKREILMKKT